jgi:hypothetical protein
MPNIVQSTFVPRIPTVRYPQRQLRNDIGRNSPSFVQDPIGQNNLISTGSPILKALAEGNSPYQLNPTLKALVEGQGFFQNSPLAKVMDLSDRNLIDRSRWNVYRVPSYESSTIRAVLKTPTVYGPVVVTPGGPPQPSPDYTPSPEALGIPDTTSSGDTLMSKDAWAEAIAYGERIAKHHRTRALVRGIQADSRTIIVTIIATVAGQYIFYLLTMK